MSSDSSINGRQVREIDLLASHHFMSVAAISQALEVSPATVRRDLEMLEQSGAVRRTHGGAVHLGTSSDGPDDISGGHWLEKVAIARAVAAMIPAGETLMINGGSTCFQVARVLHGRRLNLVTNSVPIAALLSADQGAELTLIGGYVYPRIGVAVGDMALRQVEALHAARFVTSCAGVKNGSAFEPNQMMVDIGLGMMKSCDQVILAVDHWKLDTRAVVELCALSDIDVIVTDAGVPPERREWLATLNTQVIFAEA
ncbi:MAG: DeoR/GlpR family DNA-binding transcription regulator [Phycisphaerae bacterium]|nr:DeoR/GlpR family DNA-binding transcription regulator [Phycisphaerae bacterium]